MQTCTSPSKSAGVVIAIVQYMCVHVCVYLHMVDRD